MTDTKTTARVTFDDITRIGKNRVDDLTEVEVPALGGTVVLRQISGADQDAAVAVGHESVPFDEHAVAREQIKRSLVEPALPEGEADAIIDNLPVKAFGELQALVQAHNGLLGIGVAELVKSFRLAAGADDAAENGSDGDHAPDADVAEGVGEPDAGPDDGASSVLSGDESDSAAGTKTPGNASKTRKVKA